MDFEEFEAATVAAVRAGGGEMIYDDYLAALPPIAFVSLPRHMAELRRSDNVALAVRFDGETLTTGLFISTRQGGDA